MMIFIESRLGYGLSENESDRCSCEQYLSSSENRAWKKFRPVWDLNPWPLWYQCSALPTALMSPLGAGLNVGSKLCLFTYLSMVFHIWFSHIHSHWYGLSWAEESSLLFKESLNQVCVNPGLWLTVLDREALGY